jgi:hypothetical protein
VGNSIIQGISLLLLVFATPESTFHPSTELDATLPPGSIALTQKSTTITTIAAGPSSPFKAYVLSLRLTTPQSTADPSASELILPLKSLISPTTILTTLLTAPLLATAFGIAHTIPLLLSPAPVYLRPERIGYLFILPAWISFLFYGILSLASHIFAKRSVIPSRPRTLLSLLITIPGLLLGTGCTLGFGFYLIHELTTPTIIESGNVALYVLDKEVMDGGCLWIVGALFGGLVGAAVSVNFQGEKNISFALTERDGDGVLTTATHVWQQVFIGVFVTVMPLRIDAIGRGMQGMLDGLKVTTVALGIVVLALGTGAGVLLWVKGEMVRRFDSRVLGVEVHEMRCGKDTDSVLDA